MAPTGGRHTESQYKLKIRSSPHEKILCFSNRNDCALYSHASARPSVLRVRIGNDDLHCGWVRSRAKRDLLPVSRWLAVVHCDHSGCILSLKEMPMRKLALL